MSRMLDKALDFEERWEKPITIVLGLLFVVSCAAYARFITLLDIPGIDEQTIAFWGSAAFNAIWHGFARPAMLRRKARQEQIAPPEEA